MRVAIYFTPPAGAPLTQAASLWLGRSAFDGEATRKPDHKIDGLVAAPARYGFHATMKAPFRLAEDADLGDLDARLAGFCASRDPVQIDSLVVSAQGPFFAFVPEAAPQALSDLEASVVKEFEPFRAPMDADEIARRSPDRLSARQRDNLRDWGYPYVFDDFRFHMTLTEAVVREDRGRIEGVLRRRFADVDGRPVVIDALALFLEAAPGAPFKVHSLHSFRAA